MTSRRYFGNVRKRESGRWQVRYRGPDNQLRSAPETFARKSEADRYLRLIEMRISQGEWSDPIRARVLLDDYATLWIAQRPGLRPRTVDLYSWLLKRHISPKLGKIPLDKLDTALIRKWRAGLLEAGVTQGMAAKAYRLLRAILNTAVDEDDLLITNPCRIKGAGLEKTEERPFLRAHVKINAEMARQIPSLVPWLRDSRSLTRSLPVVSRLRSLRCRWSLMSGPAGCWWGLAPASLAVVGSP